MNCATKGHSILHVCIILLLWTAVAWSAPSVPDFCFIHSADTHFSPEPVGTAPAKPGSHTYDGLAWLRDEAAKPQVIPPLNLTTSLPAFIIYTGDVTEYGVINTTWNTFESIFKPLPIPVYVTPGNHDNTWTGMMHVMRARHGSDNYSFDQFGCHFIGLNTATPQEPVPSLDQRALEWLAEDLRKVPRDVPVFMFCHHPLSSTEMAKPQEQLRLSEIIERHNVVLVMMGHGHGHRHERWNNTDSVMGGTTSHPKENIGYNVVIVKDGMLAVAFRYRDPAKPMEITLQKSLAPQRNPDIVLLAPRPMGTNAKLPSFSGSELLVRVQAREGKPGKVTASLNAKEDHLVTLTPRNRGIYEGKVPLASDGLVPGLHFVAATGHFGGRKFERAQEILYAPAGAPNAERVLLKSGVKAEPLVTDAGLLVATTAGELLRIRFDQPGRPAVETLFEAGVELLHPPALGSTVDSAVQRASLTAGRSSAKASCLYLSAAEKGVLCLSPEGRVNWTREVGAVVYGTPAADAERLYVGDMEGVVHAIDRKTGKLIWSKRHATFSIEMPVLLHEGVLYFGAWDNQVYAVNAADGSLKWKKPGPAAHSKDAKMKSRYYAAADCMPLAIGDRLFVSDRAYQLGSYRLENGEYLGHIAAGTAAIGPTADGQGFYGRGLSKGLTRYDGQGKPVWSQADVAMGRFPVRPIENAGKVFVCSNRGTATIHDASDGRVLLAYQATPGLHVMAPATGDADGAMYVAGMDGSLTRIFDSTVRSPAAE